MILLFFIMTPLSQFISLQTSRLLLFIFSLSPKGQLFHSWHIDTFIILFFVFHQLWLLTLLLYYYLHDFFSNYYYDFFFRTGTNTVISFIFTASNIAIIAIITLLFALFFCGMTIISFKLYFLHYDFFKTYSQLLQLFR